MFNIYKRSSFPITESYGFNIDAFADDDQLFKNFCPLFQGFVLSNAINDCLKAIDEWMFSHFLKLNKSKTKILVAVPKTMSESIVIHGTFIYKECIRFVSSARNLGVWLDEHMDVSVHVNKTVSSCFLKLKDIAKIKSFLPKKSLNALITSCVTYRLDYCNAVLYGINSDNLRKLQAVQNAAIKLIYGRNKFDRSPLRPLFLELHWLRIQERILFKIALIVHNCIWGLAPDALKSIITVTNLRTYKLEEKHCNGEFGDRAISRCGPKIWNNLPSEIRTERILEHFKKKMKTFLMSEDLHNFYLLLNVK